MKTKEWLWASMLIAFCFWEVNTIPASAGITDDKAVEWVDPNKILELGKKKDPSTIKYLRQIKAREEKHRHSAAFNAQIALAQIGEKPEMDEIIAETRSNDPAVQYEAIEKLRLVGNKWAVRTLIVLLDDTRIRRGLPVKGSNGRIHDSDVSYGPPSYAAILALKKIVPDGPKLIKKHPSKKDVVAWKDWWKKNKQKYE